MISKHWRKIVKKEFFLFKAISFLFQEAKKVNFRVYSWLSLFLLVAMQLNSFENFSSKTVVLFCRDPCGNVLYDRVCQSCIFIDEVSFVMHKRFLFLCVLYTGFSILCHLLQRQILVKLLQTCIRHNSIFLPAVMIFAAVVICQMKQEWMHSEDDGQYDPFYACKFCKEKVYSSKPVKPIT